MCGIFGFVGPRPLAPETISRVHALQGHRGPDDRGSWTDRFNASWLTLAFERLAIIDLSADATQPFHSICGSVLAFNGEIYNYIELRRELESSGVAFRTSSDTEVLLACLDHYGIERTLPKLNGMFAFAWLCGKSKRLWIARDRVGEKPLYYWRNGNTFAFASEIKALIGPNRLGRLSPNYGVVHNFLVNGMVDDTEDTFFAEIKSLRPAQYGEIVLASGAAELKAQTYWPPASHICESTLSLQDSIEQIRALVSDAIRIRLRSDVPLGFLVSGGLDSSIIAALSLRHGIDRERLSAFSVVNPKLPEDESRWVDSITGHLGISVNRVAFDPDGPELLGLIDDYVHYHDEPFGGLSVVAHAQLMKAAKDQGVTVLLSGQGADELFCGYRKYFYFALRQLLRQQRYSNAVGLAWSFRNDTILKFSAADAARYTKLYLPGVPTLPLGSHMIHLQRTDIGLQGGDMRDRQVADLLRYSAPAINHGEDRASMAMSREVRFPYFDPRVMEAALALPLNYKLRNGWTKYLLRAVGEPFLPSDITWRRDKVGHFSATADWLVQSAGSAAKTRLHDSSPVFKEKLLDAAKLLPRWNAFWSGAKTEFNVRQIISILTLDRWLQTFGQSFG